MFSIGKYAFQKKQYIAAAIDSFSRYVFVKACKSTGAEEMARWIVELGGMFGYPKSFRTDNARTFDNHLVQCLMQLVGSSHNPSIPYRPQSNGQVERVNAEVIRFLRYLVNDRRVQDDWESVLPIAQRIVNARGKKKDGVSFSGATAGAAARWTCGKSVRFRA